MSYQAGALIEPLSCCIRGLKNAGTGFNDDVLIVGAGPIGLFHLQLSKIAGARKVIVSEPNEQRRKVALELGADLVVDPTKEDLPPSLTARPTARAWTSSLWPSACRLW